LINATWRWNLNRLTSSSTCKMCAKLVHTLFYTLVYPYFTLFFSTHKHHYCRSAIHLSLFVQHLHMLMMIYSSILTCVVAYGPIGVIIAQSTHTSYPSLWAPCHKVWSVGSYRIAKTTVWSWHNMAEARPSSFTSRRNFYHHSAERHVSGHMKKPTQDRTLNHWTEVFMSDRDPMWVTNTCVCDCVLCLVSLLCVL